MDMYVLLSASSFSFCSYLSLFVLAKALTNPGQTVDDLLDEDELEAELAEGG